MLSFFSQHIAIQELHGNAIAVWTHKTPYVPSDLTEESIERHGRIALSRALHLDRVIAFVGSGVSAAYGGPAWTDFAGFMVAEVIEAFKNEDLPAGLDTIRDHMSKIVGADLKAGDVRLRPDFTKGIHDQITTLLAMCEDALRHIDQSSIRAKSNTEGNRKKIDSKDVKYWQDLLQYLEVENFEGKTGGSSITTEGNVPFAASARRKLAAEIIATDAEAATRRLMDFVSYAHGTKDVFAPWKNYGENIIKLWDDKEKKIKNNVKILDLYQLLLSEDVSVSTSGDGKASDPQKTGGAAQHADTIAGILDLGITRFATLNYDVTLERRIHALRGLVAEPLESRFDTLLWPDPEKPRKRGEPDILSAGEGQRAVRSTILTTGTAGELFNFALRDNASSNHVFHIHGRYDDPEGIVLTEDDYRRQYIAGGESAGVLAETMRVMFSSNDVLFIGVGLKEDDVLGPLRSVLTRDRSPDADARQTIALMPTTVPRRVKGDGDNKKAIADAAREDSLFAVHQKLKYGINVLRYGRDDAGYRELTGLIRALEYAFENQTEFKDAAWLRKATRRSSTERVLKSSDLKPQQTKLTDYESKILQLLCNRYKKTYKNIRRNAALEILKILRGRVQARALVLELERIRTDKEKWWQDWRRLPRDRRPRFHAWEQKASPYPIWIRHCPDLVTPLRAFDPRESNGAPREPLPRTFGEAVRLGRTIVVGEASHRSRTRILRLSTPRGNGKGALMRMLFAPEAHREIFGRSTYDGAFFAHMSFSTEFSSILGGLSRFIAGRIAFHTVGLQLGGSDTRDHDAEKRCQERLSADWEKWPTKAFSERYADDIQIRSIDNVEKWINNSVKKPPDKDPNRPLPLMRLEFLRGLLDRYAAVTKDPAIRLRSPDARLFICLGGLDRLCDEHGDAHNPMHRAFFRLLTGSGETLPGGGPGDPPLDIVLIASRRDAPIAYLSREIDPDDLRSRDRYDYAKTSRTKRLLKKWDLLPRLTWKDRLRLTPNWKDREDDGDSGCHRIYMRSQEILIDFLERADEPHKVYDPIRQELWESVALSSWALTSFALFVWRRRPKGSETGWKPDDRTIETLAREWLGRMSRAAGAGRFLGVLSEILLCYREIDAEGDRRRLDLRDKILETLTLHAIPVEIAVLRQCPEIRALLESIEIEERDKPLPTLWEALDTLVARGLLIKVRPGGSAGALAQTSEPKASDRSEYEFHERYVIHDQLRELIAGRMRLFVPDGGNRNHFQVSLYCEQPRDTPTPSMRQFKEVSGIARQMIGRSRDTLGALYVLKQFAYDRDGRPMTQRHAERIRKSLDEIETICFRDGDAGGGGPVDHHRRLHAMPQRLRACYALLRGSFSISVLSRLSGEDIGPDDERPFDAYRGWLRGLINAAVGLHEVEPLTREIIKGKRPDRSEGGVRRILEDLRENIVEKGAIKAPEADEITGDIYVRLSKIIEDLTNKTRPLQESHIGSVKHPYYIDEIAWLLNERGLASLVQGRVHDAVQDFERALAWVARDPQGTEDPSYRALERRIRLNWAIAMIDYGFIGRARSALEAILATIVPFEGGTPSAVHLHTRGYLALCDHLTGNFQEAERGYERAVEACNAAGNLRAAALYNGHHADLLSRLGKAQAARDKITLARAAAAQSEQRDVLHLVILKHAQQLISEGNTKGAIERITQVSAYGDALGLHKIRAEALLARAEALLMQGDARSAGAAAAEGVAICHRHGLRLRRIAVSILYGETLFARGEKTLAKSVIAEAKSEADRIGYHLKAARAQRVLSSFEYATPNPTPADYAGARAGMAW